MALALVPLVGVSYRPASPPLKFSPQTTERLKRAFKTLNDRGIVPEIISGFIPENNPDGSWRKLSDDNLAWHQAGAAIDIDGNGLPEFQTIIKVMKANGFVWSGDYASGDYGNDPTHFDGRNFMGDRDLACMKAQGHWQGAAKATNSQPQSPQGQAARDALIAAQNRALDNPDFQATLSVSATGKTMETTHCNQALIAITREMRGPMNVITGNATNIINNLSGSSEFHEGTSEEAQQAANRGVLAVATWMNPDPKDHSHVASVRPEGVPGDSPRPGSGPLLANIGPSKYSGLVHKSGAFAAGKEVIYYIANER